MKAEFCFSISAVILISMPVSGVEAATRDDRASEILDASDVKGGLVVVVGCENPDLLVSLRASDSYLVHGLDTDAKRVAEARRAIQAKGLYGNVSVDQWDGTALPYVNDIVNLLVVANDEIGVSSGDVMGALAPRGVAIAHRTARFKMRNSDVAGDWRIYRKPVPADIDEWTHHLHDAGGNAVAADRVVGPPRHLQWTAGPLWARSHGWTPSVTAMVSSGGRLFYICDETLTGASAAVPNKWYLVARDAFSGVLLWKRSIARWGSAEFSGTPDTGAGITTGRFTMPQQAAKRLVAVGNTVYVTLGVTAPVTALDAATGEERRVYPETANADEILYVDGRLFVAINPFVDVKTLIPGGKEPPAPPPGKRVRALDAETGRVLWTRGPFVGVRSSRGQDPFGRLELTAGDGRVFALTQNEIVCLAADSGDTAWRIDRPALSDAAVRKLGFAGVFEFLLTVLVYHDGVVLLAQPEPNIHHTYHTMPGTLYAFDAGDGSRMWKHFYGGWGHCTQPDVFVVGDRVWTHVHVDTEYGPAWGKGYRAKDTSKVDYRIQALDLGSGEVRKEFSTRDIFNVGHHNRCYRARITERYLMSSRRGVEFVDLKTGENFQNHWVRSGCLLGNLPCNGLLYVSPHPCSCYITAKLTGFNALAPSRRPKSERRLARKNPVPEKGPAYGTIQNPQSKIQNRNDWPTYRHDPRRSGATELAVDTKLTVAWRSRISARPSAPVVADGKVLVAGVDAHTVHALDADDGRSIWEYTAAARVDSPPTVQGGRAIFGSRDGRVYCLRAADGAFAWRLEAAPRRSLVTAFGQLESPWPVPGSVLVHDGKCWFAAGRSSYLDGGIHLYCLDPATGNAVRKETIYSPDPETGKMAWETSMNTMAGLLNDIPVSDGAGVFIRQMNVSATDSDSRAGRHLYTTAGYLDSSGFNRTYWRFGGVQSSGLMVLGKNVVYGVELYPTRGNNTVFTPGAGAYRLMCQSLKPPALKKDDEPTTAGRQRKRQRRPKPIWEQRVGIRITAMVRAADTIFVGGSPDVVDPEDPHGAWEGRKGGVLAAFAAADGEKLAEYPLESPPVWDGMAAAHGRLYVSLCDGTIVCLRKADQRRWVRY